MPYESLYYFAKTTEVSEDAGILGALGIQWQMLLFQTIAFAIVVALLAKFVYPVLLRVIDEREAKINESLAAASVAQEKAESAVSSIDDDLKKAQAEARDIVATAKQEAAATVDKADKAAKARGERMVEEAQETIAKDVLKARETLQKDTLELVKRASSLATAGLADSKLDTALIKKSIDSVPKEVKK